MKRLLAALLAVLMLLSLAACKKTKAPETPEEPEITEPQEPDTETQEPEEEVPAEPAEPEPDDDTPSEPAPEGTAVVEDQVSEGQVEEAISYKITVPKISTGDAAADEILSAYYTSAAGKVEDLCWGELYEEALASQEMYHVEAGYTVMRNDGEILSIRRDVLIINLKTDQVEETTYAETFSLPGGGLMTAQDFFTMDPTDRLVEQVQRIISENPYHSETYDPQWSELCRSAFNKDQFYVTDEAYVVFYHSGDLGPAGQIVFEIPWDSLRDITK